MAFSTRNYGAGDPKCDICHGIGWFRYNVPEDHPQFGRVHPCECRNVDPTGSGLSRAWMHSDHVREALRITSDWWHDKPGREKQQAACDTILSAAKAGSGGLLTLVGDAGTGKTSLLYWLAVELIKAGIDVVYCDAEIFKQATSISTALDDGSLPGVNRLNNCTVALLDNLDDLRPTVATGESYAAEMVRQIGKRRYTARHDKVTVWAFNNEAWDSLGGVILHSLFDRLREGVVIRDRTSNFRAALGTYEDPDKD